MAVFTVTSGAVILGAGVGAGTDVTLNGILTSASGGRNRATLASGDEYCNGVWLSDAGRISYVDATAGLPADAVWSNGLPRSGGKLCVSSDAAATYSNGIPFAANGAVSVVVIL